MVKGKTIRIYLPTGDPKEAKIADISSEMGKLIFVSRKNIDWIKMRDEKDNTGIYFLIGDIDPESDKRIVYIGEAEKLFDRLNTHIRDSEKDWFSGIIFFTTKDNSLNKAMVKYFESYCIDKASIANKYKIENRKASNLANISESDQADLENYFDTLKLLMSTIGHPLFEQETESPLYICKEAFGEFLDEGFLVKKGSKINSVMVPSLYLGIKKQRDSLIKEGIIKDFLFTKDHLLSSPSLASSLVLGRPSNGWIEWKNKSGKSLDEMKRRIL